jgi:hypothetical protein
VSKFKSLSESERLVLLKNDAFKAEVKRVLESVYGSVLVNSRSR